MTAVCACLCVFAGEFWGVVCLDRVDVDQCLVGPKGMGTGWRGGQHAHLRVWLMVTALAPRHHPPTYICFSGVTLFPLQCVVFRSRKPAEGRRALRRNILSRTGGSKRTGSPPPPQLRSAQRCVEDLLPRTFTNDGKHLCNLLL